MSSSRYQPSDEFGINPFDIWLNGKGCPDNTVPIKRVTKEDLIRINKATELAYRINDNPGVQVNPSLYPDNQTHLFIYTITNHSRCYNTYCPGFITMTPDMPPDMVLPYHVPGGTVWQLGVYVRKDAANGDWFLNLGKNNDTIGSWPQRIFSELASHTNFVSWGGEVYSPPGTDTPVMGAGPLAKRLSTDDCFIANIRIINENHEVDSHPSGCETIVTSDRYKIIDYGDADSGLGRVIFFGGA
ncbi:hypothetical protein LINPERHAP2_LOCUS40151 [Linum perenne]